MPTPHVAAFEANPLWQRAREPIFWLDPALKLVWVNRAWEELTGHASESVVGLTCQGLGPIREGEPAGLAASFQPPLEAMAGQPAGGPTWIDHPCGERLWRRVEFWPFHDEDDQLLGLLGTVRSAGSRPSAADPDGGRLHDELREVRHRLQDRYGFEGLVGFGPAHRRLLDQVRLAAGSTVPVLIVGEPGTGKRQVARTIHQHGPNRQRPLIAFDCQALPPEVLERELFGVPDPAAMEAMSHAGPPRSRSRLCDGTSLLIVEVPSLPRDLQLRLVESLDARGRLLATMTIEPESALRTERLRPDLYFVLTTLVLRLLPLRERRDELPALAQHLLERGHDQKGPHRAGFSSEAISVLMAYDWPGNLSELVRVVEHARVSSGAEGALIDAEDLPATIRGSVGGAFAPPSPPNTIKPLDALLTEVERRLIETALYQSRSNKSRAAEILGISRPRLYRRIEELNLPEDEPGGEPGPLG